MSTSTFAISPLDTVIDDEGESRSLWTIEVHDLARGFAGALFLALPLLFTLEMWQRARVIPIWDLSLIMVLAYFGNVGFSMFSGFKPTLKRRAAWFDAFTSLGIGLVASAITLVLINQVNVDMPTVTVVKLILLEAVPASFGASLAINQLGSRKAESDTEFADTLNLDLKKILGTFLGALMFSFNIAPTVETQVIGNGLSWWHTVGIVVFSLAVSALLVFFADFVERDNTSGILKPKWLETLFAYLVSLLVSALLLWMFGYIGPGTPLTEMVPRVVTLGYGTTLAGAAGRLIL